MKHSKQELDAIMDDVMRDIRDEQIDPSIISQSATRVWARGQPTGSGKFILGKFIFGRFKYYEL